MTTSGFRAARNYLTQDSSAQWEPGEADPTKIVEFLMYTLGKKYWGGRYYLPEDWKKLKHINEDSFPTIEEAQRRLGIDFVNTFHYSAGKASAATGTTPTGEIQFKLENKPVTITDNHIEITVPDDSDEKTLWSDDDAYQGVSASFAYTLTAGARSIPAMANNGIEVYGPPQDKAMYIIAARHAGLLVVNEKQVMAEIGPEYFEEAAAKFSEHLNAMPHVARSGISKTAEEIFTHPTNALLRKGLQGPVLGGAALLTTMDTDVIDDLCEKQALIELINTHRQDGRFLKHKQELGTIWQQIGENNGRNSGVANGARLDKFLNEFKATLSPGSDLKNLSNIQQRLAAGERHANTPPIMDLAIKAGRVTKAEKEISLSLQACVRQVELAITALHGEEPANSYISPRNHQGELTSSFNDSGKAQATLLRLQNALKAPPDNHQDLHRALPQSLDFLSSQISHLGPLQHGEFGEELKSLGRAYLDIVRQVRDDISSSPEPEAGNVRAQWRVTLASSFTEEDLNRLETAFTPGNINDAAQNKKAHTRDRPIYSGRPKGSEPLLLQNLP